MTALSRLPFALLAALAAVPALLLGYLSERAVTHAASKGQAMGFHIAAYLAGLLLTLIVSRILLRLFGAGSPELANIASAGMLGLGLAAMAVISTRPGNVGPSLVDILGYPLALVAAPQAVWLLGDLSRAEGK